MTRLTNRRRIGQAAMCLLIGLGLVQPLPRSQRAMAQNAKPVVHVFLQLDAKSSVIFGTGLSELQCMT